MISFQDLGLNSDILLSLADIGFDKPMPIQEKIIPLLLRTNQDVIGLAQTGTGKTAAFGLPLVNKVAQGETSIKALVLSPTRELAVQIEKDITAFAKDSKHVKATAVYGGAPIDAQIRALKKKPQILVATPGRVLDLIKRRKVDLSELETLVLDEADEMLNFGFRDELEAVIKEAPEDKQVLLFSATFSKDISRIAQTYMNQPQEVSVGKRNSGSDNVQFVYYMTRAKEKYAVLRRLIDYTPSMYGIVFCRTRNETREIAEKLVRDGYGADALHGDLSQAQRDHTMKRFRAKNLQILVATDVAARGLDVNELTHVVNYNLPDEVEVYTHRSGRTGRAGNKGICVALVNSREIRKLARIEKVVGKEMQQVPIPSGFDICEKQLFNFIGKLSKVEVNDKQIEEYLPNVLKQLEWMDKEQLIKHMVSLEWGRFLDAYSNAPDLNEYSAGASKSGSKTKKGKKANQGELGDRGKRSQYVTDYTRLFVNVGKKEQITPGKLMSIVNSAVKGSNFSFGAIDIKSRVTSFEVEGHVVEQILAKVSGRKFSGSILEVSLNTGPPTKGSTGAKSKTKAKKKDKTKEKKRAGKKKPRKPKKK